MHVRIEGTTPRVEQGKELSLLVEEWSSPKSRSLQADADSPRPVTHVFEFIAYLADMSESFDLAIGQKSMYELEVSVDFNNLAFSFLKRSLPVCAVDNFNIRPGKTKDIIMELKDIPFKISGYKDFPETSSNCSQTQI